MATPGHQREAARVGRLGEESYELVWGRVCRVPVDDTDARGLREACNPGEHRRGVALQGGWSLEVACHLDHVLSVRASVDVRHCLDPFHPSFSDSAHGFGDFGSGIEFDGRESHVEVDHVLRRPADRDP